MAFQNPRKRPQRDRKVLVSEWEAAWGCSDRTTLLEASPLNSLPWVWELLPDWSSTVGIEAARASPKGRSHVRNKGPQRGRGERGSQWGEGWLLPSLSAPPSSLRPPPPPSSSRGRVGGRASFTERPQVAGCTCGVRWGAWRKGTGLPKPWLWLRRPPPAANGIGVLGKTDRSLAAGTPPSWRRFPPSEGTSRAAPPCPHSPGTQSGRRGERGPNIF